MEESEGRFPEGVDKRCWYIGNNEKTLREELIRAYQEFEGDQVIRFCPSAVGQTIEEFFNQRFWNSHIAEFIFNINQKAFYDHTYRLKIDDFLYIVSHKESKTPQDQI